MAWKTNSNGTKHSNNCRMAFGRKDPNCPRCQELLNGAKPLTWNNQSQDSRRVEAIKAHDCKKAGCGSVCTFGDW